MNNMFCFLTGQSLGGGGRNLGGEYQNWYRVVYAFGTKFRPFMLKYVPVHLQKEVCAVPVPILHIERLYQGPVERRYNAPHCIRRVLHCHAVAL